MKEKNRIITELLLQKYSLDVSKYDEAFLNKSLEKRIVKTQCSTEEMYYRFLEQNEKEGALFLDSLFISYSEFFRNPLTFSVLEKIIIPSILLKKENAKRKEIRIWSAACALGQETYSLAILLKEFTYSDGEKINFRIFATDQSEWHVHEAQKGSFTENSVTKLNLKQLNQWFDKQGEVYCVKQELKESIDFSTFDLFNKQFSCPPSSIFGDFDMVICANLLFYYKAEYRLKILEKTGNSLAAGGYLITGETERDILKETDYREVFPLSAIFRRK